MNEWMNECHIRREANWCLNWNFDQELIQSTLNHLRAFQLRLSQNLLQNTFNLSPNGSNFKGNSPIHKFLQRNNSDMQWHLVLYTCSVKKSCEFHIIKCISHILKHFFSEFDFLFFSLLKLCRNTIFQTRKNIL